MKEDGLTLSHQNNLASYDLSKKVINLLRHNQTLQREEDGAIEFCKIKFHLRNHHSQVQNWSDDRWKACLAAGGGSKRRYQFCSDISGTIIYLRDGRIKTLGGDQELRTSTLVRRRPIQGEGHIDILGESEGSLSRPHDSVPVAGDAMNDFWSMSGSFIFRHHVEPRVKLYSPREESFPIPLKYIDVTRTTHSNLDVKQEKRIDDYWNTDGSQDLSDPWTGFTQFTLLDEKAPDGYMRSG